MKIRRVLESIFGSPARVNILRILYGSPQPLNGRQVGELAGLTHRGAIHALKSLAELDVNYFSNIGADVACDVPPMAYR